MTTPTVLSEQVQTEIHQLRETIHSLVENMHRLRSPVAESHQKVPQATNQLDKISQQTLAAAHRMLDTVEGINNREDEILKAVKRLSSDTAVSNSVRSELLIIEKAAQENMDAAYTLMDALQFQDITSQQVDYAASLLEEIETKLAHILKVVGSEHEQIISASSQMPRKQRAFDPHADLFEKKTQQSEIDDLFVKKK
jgi:chemotaxis regulatin CheY-phosphate phosphatase CheZ